MLPLLEITLKEAVSLRHDSLLTLELYKSVTYLLNYLVRLFVVLVCIYGMYVGR